MDKIKEHLKNNLAIYLVILACIVIVCVAIFVKEEKKDVVDISMFKSITLSETNALFNDDDPKFLVISVNTCSATAQYVEYLQFSMLDNDYQVYYLDLNTIDENNKEDMKEYQKLTEHLDYEYNFNGNIAPISNFIGNTPMTIIIKDKKVVFGYIGSMNTTTLKSIVNMYGVSNKNEQE